MANNFLLFHVISVPMACAPNHIILIGKGLNSEVNNGK